MLGARSVFAAVLVAATMASTACTRLNPDALLDGGSGGAIDLALPSSVCDPSQLASDPRHCGGCDNDCATLPNVDGTRVSCAGGVCNVGGACLSGFGDCTSAPGCETNLGTPDHCGSCTLACGGADPLCAVDGSGKHECASSCGAATLCDGQCVDTSSDPANCGGCAVGCATPAHGEPACANGQCGFTCDAGWTKTPTGCVGGSGGGGGGGGGGGLGGFGGGGGGGNGGSGGGGGTPQCGMTGATCASMSDCCSGLCLVLVCL